MPQNPNISHEFLDTACSNGRNKKIFVGGGLYLFVSPRNSKHWRAAYRVDGRQQTASFGVFPIVSLAQARRMLSDLKAGIKAGSVPNFLDLPVDRSVESCLKHSSLVEWLDYSAMTGEFRWRYPKGKSGAGDVAGSETKFGYVVIGLCGASYFAHRLAWFYVHGVWPSIQIDHKNRIKTDNRIDNLRDVTAAINTQNRARDLKAHVLPGVRATNKGWCAEIMCKGIRIKSDSFSTPEDAGAFYLELQGKLHDGYLA